MNFCHLSPDLAYCSLCNVKTVPRQVCNQNSESPPPPSSSRTGSVPDITRRVNIFSTNDPYGPMSGRNLVTMEGAVEVEDEVEAPVPPIPQQTYHSYCDLHCKARHRRPDKPDRQEHH